jgi:hypothetical protein
MLADSCIQDRPLVIYLRRRPMRGIRASAITRPPRRTRRQLHALLSQRGKHGSGVSIAKGLGFVAAVFILLAAFHGTSKVQTPSAARSLLSRWQIELPTRRFAASGKGSLAVTRASEAHTLISACREHGGNLSDAAIHEILAVVSGAAEVGVLQFARYKHMRVSSVVNCFPSVQAMARLTQNLLHQAPCLMHWMVSKVNLASSVRLAPEQRT